MALFVGYSWVRKLLFLSKVANIVRRWGFGANIVPRFRDIPLGPAKVPSSGFLGFVASGFSNLQRGGFFCLLRVLKLIPIFLFVFL